MYGNQSGCNDALQVMLPHLAAPQPLAPSLQPGIQQIYQCHSYLANLRGTIYRNLKDYMKKKLTCVLDYRIYKNAMHAPPVSKDLHTSVKQLFNVEDE